MEKIKEPLKLGGILGAIALVIAVLLSFVNGITADRIAEVNGEIVQKGLKEVMPSEREIEFIPMEGGVDLSNEKNIEVSNLYIAMDIDGNIVGYCATVLPEGYGGPVETIVGMDLTGTVTGVKVTSNMSETPGLGAKALKRENFTYQFEKRTPSFAITRDGGDVDAITSATITSRAITEGVNAAAEVINKNSAFEKVEKSDIIDGKYIVKAEEPQSEEEEETGEKEDADNE